jgi:hypothetical protein
MSPGFIGVGAGKWTIPTPATGGAGGFYAYTEDSGGYRKNAAGAWSVWGSPFGTVPTSGLDTHKTIHAMAVARDDPATIYAFPARNASMYASTDGGATWTAHANPAGASFVAKGAVSPSAGQLYVSGWGDTGFAPMGIWRSLDGGASWTQILTLPGTSAWQIGRLDIGTDALWVAFGRTGVSEPIFYCLPLTGPGEGTVPFGPSLSGFQPQQVVAISDELAVSVSYYGGQVYRLTPTTATVITPPGEDGNCLWIEPINATTYLCVVISFGPTETRLYRTTDSGGSWALVRTFTNAEGPAQGAAADSYQFMAHDVGVVWLLGRAAFDIQQLIWTSTDQGLTWTSSINEAELHDSFGDFGIYGTGGIVGEHGGPATFPGG